ncbi:hypothetical protein RDV64_01605 [Acuticoccus sp. MNP-M23]|uniref:hypothetical protein n=1 Tax=Acuticoccus sp. MNP-M23 TaxID=3072793 RepID=UPI002816082A|nr:hypothetical protein [Acuticoccus sp. MNP-M23]WMS43128.1 hypothetical protein RDV64_01605 [Acuticoccus sp. MNP-M23]
MDQTEYARAQAAIIREYVEGKLGPILERMAGFESRVKFFESRALHYSGVYQRALGYKRNAAVTHGGALWVAIQDVEPGAIPGKGDGWQLAVKSAPPTQECSK